MKTLGLLGGMSWESTVTYYQQINRRVRSSKGDLSSAKCLLYSFDFAEIEALQHAGKWDALATMLEDTAAKLSAAGADAIVLCTNTMHLAAGGIEAAAGVPLIHIADATAERIVEARFSKVALLGTRFTMEKDFYKARLQDKFGLEVVVPDDKGMQAVHDIIYNELCMGVVKDESRKAYQEVIEDLKREGAQCLILGCTEIGLLIDESSSVLPIFDTAAIHATAAADWAMK